MFSDREIVERCVCKTADRCNNNKAEDESESHVFVPFIYYGFSPFFCYLRAVKCKIAILRTLPIIYIAVNAVKRKFTKI